jgi:hypothetical protein
MSLGREMEYRVGAGNGASGAPLFALASENSVDELLIANVAMDEEITPIAGVAESVGNVRYAVEVTSVGQCIETDDSYLGLMFEDPTHEV